MLSDLIYVSAPNSATHTHSQGVAFGDLSRLVKQSREDQEETRAYTQEETTPQPRIRPELIDGGGNLRAEDIGITWQDGDTFLHGVRIAGRREDMEDSRRRPATAAPYPPCREEMEDVRRRPAMSTPYPQKSVNNSNCPECKRLIKVNMGRHIRFMHSTYVCFWRCPVLSCSLWFTSELNAKDHIEGIHKFQEGHGTSFYECLRQHGIEWFGSRTFFDQRKDTNQAIWMDMALAAPGRVRNSEIPTSLQRAQNTLPLRRLFKVAVDGLQLVFDRSLVTSVQPKSLLAQMREAVADCDDGSSDGSLMLLSPPHDIPEASLPAESSMDLETRDVVSPVVMPRRVTPANRPLQHLEAGRLGASTPPAREVATGGARPLHRQLQSTVTDGPPAYGPAVASHRHKNSFVAGGRSP